MKEGWEYKIIAEICDKASSNLAQNKIENIDGQYPVYGASGFVKTIDFFHREKEYIGVVKDGSGVGRVNIYPAQSSLLGTMQYIIPKEGFSLGFVAYALKGLNLASFASGAAIPHIYFKDYGKCKINVPPLTEQERIVSELDLLTSIINKQKEQLKELDSLAQSIFYDMFGDPIENPKGWEIKKWVELFDTRLGKMLDRKKQVSSDKLCPYLANINVKWGCVDLSALNEMTFSDNEIKEFQLEKGDLLICEGGEAGRCAIWNFENSNIKFQKAIHRARIKNNMINNVFTCYYIMFLKREGGLKDYISKATIEHLTGVKLNTVPVFLPPLSLQQSYVCGKAASNDK